MILYFASAPLPKPPAGLQKLPASEVQLIRDALADAEELMLCSIRSGEPYYGAARDAKRYDALRKKIAEPGGGRKGK